VHIGEIWAWEAIQHGDAALLNADNLGGLCEAISSATTRDLLNSITNISIPDDWSDNSRDMANFILHYLPVDIDPETLPVHLERVTESETATRAQYGVSDRTIVAIGHSFGGATMLVSETRVNWSRHLNPFSLLLIELELHSLIQRFSRI
jgi:hypothetical protein